MEPPAEPRHIIEGEIITRVRYPDGGLELHVRLVTLTESLRLIDIRDYVPETGEYKRGVMFPIDFAPDIFHALAEIIQKEVPQ